METIDSSVASHPLPLPSISNLDTRIRHASDPGKSNRPPFSKRKSLIDQPKNTIEYSVNSNDSLDKIAVRFGITASELVRLNHLNSRMIFPGQILFVPDPDSEEPVSFSPTSPVAKTGIQDLPVVKQKSIDVPVVMAKSKNDKISKFKLSKSKSSDQGSKKQKLKSFLRKNSDPKPGKVVRTSSKESETEIGSKQFLKLNVKYITDGEGVVNGTMLVTPNAIMFDPNVSDPLVIDRGTAPYGVLSPMDQVLGAAMYRDIAPMTNRDGTHEVYCPIHTEPSLGVDPSDLMKDRSESVCSCGNGSLKTPTLDATFETMPTLIPDQSKQDENEVPCGNLIDITCSDNENNADEESPQTLVLDHIGETDKEENKIEMTNKERTDTTNGEADDGHTTSSCAESSLSNIDDQVEPSEHSSDLFVNNAVDKIMQDILNTIESKEVESRLNGEVAVSSQLDDKISNQSKPSVNDCLQRCNHTISADDELSKSQNFVNFSAGIFVTDCPRCSVVPDMNECIHDTTATEQELHELEEVGKEIRSGSTSDENPTSPTIIPRLCDIPGGFKAFEPKPAKPNDHPPLYLCLKVYRPMQKTFIANRDSEAIKARGKVPEYWFAIPRDRADLLYDFFLQWSPEVYGKEDLYHNETGFILIDQDDVSMNIVEDFFHDPIEKDWEIVTKDEANRRRMTILECERDLPLPDVIGETLLLTNEHIRQFVVGKYMPARIEGHSWCLVYSTAEHGFSLKSLYRKMQGEEGPMLIIIKDTDNRLFGALTNSPMKMSDHFYGTGETFLYHFLPDLIVYKWTGENNFFVKGDLDSIAIGGGDGKFGLWLDGDLYHGRSHTCKTFDNEVLSQEEDFTVSNLEVWSFCCS
ncbi:nuclear receptor coactivator 7-like isoform X2 [Anneissia japonica]|uniref:nuclear receptor coactivator 7-like isoform X2 n=1 Tax=Anneissia japonica TaxID=1529436 RepID=UPI0014255D72|nr:nuclear receptor coactivator 7-like isoform X2 [Anneissia japonica]